MPLSKSKLIEAAKFLFKEKGNITRMVVEVLLTKKLRIDFDEIADIAKKLDENGNLANLAREAVLAMEEWRLMLPFRAKLHRSTAWEDRINIPNRKEIYEVPICVAYAFDHLTSDGVWDWRSSIGKYMEIISQQHKDVVLSVIDEVVNKLYFKRFTNARTINEACENHDYQENVDLLIAELKGGGIISPCLGYSLFSRRSFAKHLQDLYEGRPLYEVNKALFVLELENH